MTIFLGDADVASSSLARVNLFGCSILGRRERDRDVESFILFTGWTGK